MQTISPSSSPSLADPLPLLTDVRLFRSSRASRRPRQLVAWLLVGIAVLLLAATHAGAQEGDPQIAARQFLGAAPRDGVVVRSGPSAGDFGAVTLDRGQQVVVVGASGEYLRILPPEKAFCLVPKASVNLRGEAAGERIGRVSDKCSVRVGSAINQVVGAAVGRLSPGDEVQVVGEDSQYYHVTPPKGTFFYVGQDDLERVREVRVTATARGWKVGELPTAAAEPAPTVTRTPEPKTEPEPAEPTPEPVADAAPAADAAVPPGDDDGAAEAITPPPAEAVAEAETSPATQPSLVEAFRDLDARYVEAAAGPLEGQPLGELQAEYQDMLVRAETDPAGAAIRPVIEARLKTIEVRQAALDDLKTIQSMREQMVRRQRALEAEQEELATRAQGANVTMYAAVGQVQPSSLQVGGGGALYRLCDPATGRTLIYLRATGQTAVDLARSIDKFVGVKGETVTDGELEMKYVKVSDVAAVDQGDLFDTVAAELIPPSLVQNAAAN